MTKKARADRWLQHMFRTMNIGFFEGKIPKSTVVRFARIKDDGQTSSTEGVSTILIHSDLIKHPDLGTIVLLHEMVHAHLRHSNYVGYDHLGGHGTLFHAGIDRLYKIGAYETLL